MEEEEGISGKKALKHKEDKTHQIYSNEFYLLLIKNGYYLSKPFMGWYTINHGSQYQSLYYQNQELLHIQSVFL